MELVESKLAKRLFSNVLCNLIAPKEWIHSLELVLFAFTEKLLYRLCCLSTAATNTARLGAEIIPFTPLPTIWPHCHELIDSGSLLLVKCGVWFVFFVLLNI